MKTKACKCNYIFVHQAELQTRTTYTSTPKQYYILLVTMLRMFVFLFAFGFVSLHKNTTQNQKVHSYITARDVTPSWFLSS